MAKVISPFKIQGTLDDLNFVLMPNGHNYVRSKKEGGLTSEEFKKNPIYDPIRKHGQEWAYCVKKSHVFRQLASRFFDNAKDGSFSGRSNKVLFEIICEDTVNEKGGRNLSEGMQSPYLSEILVGFQGNKLRPIQEVLRAPFVLDTTQTQLWFTNFNILQDIDWPAEATDLELSLCASNWDYDNDAFETTYGDTLHIKKNDGLHTFALECEASLTTKCQLIFLHAGFSNEFRGRLKPLARKYNSAGIIGIKHP